MLKKELVSIVRNLLPREDKTSKYHYEVVSAAIGLIYAKAAHDAFMTNPRELDSYVKTFGVSTALPVVEEGATGIYYTTLPAHFIPIPDKASGVRRVDAVEQAGLAFYPVDSREADLLLNGSFFTRTSTRVGYVVKPSRVEFINWQTAVTAVRMDIVVEFMDLDDDDVVYVPSGQEDAFIKSVLEVLGVIPPVDLSDNNSDNTAQK